VPLSCSFFCFYFLSGSSVGTPVDGTLGLSHLYGQDGMFLPPIQPATRRTVQLAWVLLAIAVMTKQILSSVAAPLLILNVVHVQYPLFPPVQHHHVLWEVLAPTEQGPPRLQQTMASSCLAQDTLDRRTVVMASLPTPAVKCWATSCLLASSSALEMRKSLKTYPSHGCTAQAIPLCPNTSPPYFHPHLSRVVLRANLQTAPYSTKRKSPSAVPRTQRAILKTQRSSPLAAYASRNSVRAARKMTIPRIPSLSQDPAAGVTPSLVCERAGSDLRHLVADRIRAGDQIKTLRQPNPCLAAGLV
jgi:hypothetical protein